MNAAGPILETRELVKHFPLRRTVRESMRGGRALAVHAVDGVSVSIPPGQTLGLIGESGSGKTTFGWLVARLSSPTSGQVLFEGKDVTKLRGRALRAWHRNVQMVFQDPVGSLDPRLRVWQIVGEPLLAQYPLDRRVAIAERKRIQRARRTRSSPASESGSVSIDTVEPRLPEVPARPTRESLRQRVREVLPTVGLPPDCLDQYPHEFSGGGRQRISLARALSVNPKLVVLDEPTSALDVAVQAQILNRLVSLQRERGLSYLLITHNVAAVRYVAHRVAVMYLGEIVEVGPVRAVLERPVHPYTKALLAAVPVPDVRRRRARYRITGEIPTLVNPPPGCRFAPRCPFVIERCRVEAPALREVPAHPGTQVSCHRAEEVGDVPPETFIAQAPSPTIPRAADPVP